MQYYTRTDAGAFIESPRSPKNQVQEFNADAAVQERRGEDGEGRRVLNCSGVLMRNCAVKAAAKCKW